jgi:hypothetical protein
VIWWSTYSDQNAYALNFISSSLIIELDRSYKHSDNS